MEIAFDLIFVALDSNMTRICTKESDWMTKTHIKSILKRLVIKNSMDTICHILKATSKFGRKQLSHTFLLSFLRSQFYTNIKIKRFHSVQKS